MIPLCVDLTTTFSFSNFCEICHRPVVKHWSEIAKSRRSVHNGELILSDHRRLISLIRSFRRRKKKSKTYIKAIKIYNLSCTFCNEIVAAFFSSIELLCVSHVSLIEARKQRGHKKWSDCWCGGN
jgi:hypothetical protein